MNHSQLFKRISNFSFLFFLLFYSILLAQNKSVQIADRVGIGVSIEKQLGIKFDRYYNHSAGISKVYVPLTFGSKIKVEPEFAYWRYSRSMGNDKFSFSNFHYGFGIFYLFRIENTIFYFGPRFAIDHIKLPNYDSDDIKKTKNDYNYGLALGGEYFFANNFSLGAEVQMMYIFIGEETHFYESNQKLIANEALVALLFYF